MAGARGTEASAIRKNRRNGLGSVDPRRFRSISVLYGDEDCRKM